jgi:hypothetical protein
LQANIDGFKAIAGKPRGNIVVGMTVTQELADGLARQSGILRQHVQGKAALFALHF